MYENIFNKNKIELNAKFTVRLLPEERSAFNEICKMNNVSMNTVLRNFIQETIKVKETTHNKM